MLILLLLGRLPGRRSYVAASVGWSVRGRGLGHPIGGDTCGCVLWRRHRLRGWIESGRDCREPRLSVLT